MSRIDWLVSTHSARMRKELMCQDCCELLFKAVHREAESLITIISACYQIFSALFSAFSYCDPWGCQDWPLNRFSMRCALVCYVKSCIFPVKFCQFFCFSDRASSASTTQTMKIIEFSLFSVLVFKGLRNNKPDKVFGKPLSFFFGRKSWQKEPHARYRFRFSGTPAA